MEDTVNYTQKPKSFSRGNAHFPKCTPAQFEQLSLYRKVATE